MTSPTPEEIAAIARSLTKAQREAVYKALVLLDGFAGSGIGHEDGDGEMVWSDDVWLSLSDAFLPELDGEHEAIAPIFRQHLLSQETSDGD